MCALHGFFGLFGNNWKRDTRTTSDVPSIIPVDILLYTHEANVEWLYGPDGLASMGTDAVGRTAALGPAASGDTPCEDNDGWLFLCTGSGNSDLGSPSIFFKLSDASVTDA